MTNTELIQKIKAEIERRITDNTFGAKLELIDILSFLSTLESEKPMDLDDEIKRFVAEYGYERSEDILLIAIVARHFAEWGIEHLANFNYEIVINGHKFAYNKDNDAITIVETPNDLEEAADEYEKKHTYQRYDGGGLTPEYNATLAEAFIAGYNLCKEQMMKEAVEGKVFMSFAPGHNQMVMADVDLPTNTKVRIIIVKED